LSLLAFYRHQAPDDRGRTLDDVRALDLKELERVHDYIQWLFPLDTPSGANPSAPTLTPDTIATFRDDPALQNELLISLGVMLRFYSLPLPTPYPLAPIPSAITEWFRPGNHNFLRLTRIMRSLTLLGLRGHAATLLDQLEQLCKNHPSIVGDLTITHWRRALDASP
jgi:Opioid growth factor receptor (OGFr) conserved region